MAQVSKINMGGIDYDIRDKVLEQEVANIKPIVNQGTINNAADEEDLTSENSLLKLKDRTAVNGMGYVILRKNKTFAEQVTQEDTIYEVRYDMDLKGATYVMPNGCTLRLNGGQFYNGTISGNFVIEGKVSDKRVFVDGYNFEEKDLLASNVGMIENNEDAASHNTRILSRLLTEKKNLILDDCYYFLGNGLNVEHDFTIRGNGNARLIAVKGQAFLKPQGNSSLIIKDVDITSQVSYFIFADRVDYKIHSLIIKGCKYNGGRIVECTFADNDYALRQFGFDNFVVEDSEFTSPNSLFVLSDAVVSQTCSIRRNIFYDMHYTGFSVGMTNEFTHSDANRIYWCDMFVEDNVVHGGISDTDSYCTFLLAEVNAVYYRRNVVKNLLNIGSGVAYDAYVSSVRYFSENNVFENIATIPATGIVKPTMDEIGKSKGEGKARYFANNTWRNDYTEIRQLLSEYISNLPDEVYSQLCNLAIFLYTGEQADIKFTNNKVEVIGGILCGSGSTIPMNRLSITNNYFHCDINEFVSIQKGRVEIRNNVFIGSENRKATVLFRTNGRVAESLVFEDNILNFAWLAAQSTCFKNISINNNNLIDAVPTNSNSVYLPSAVEFSINEYVWHNEKNDATLYVNGCTKVVCPSISPITTRVFQTPSAIAKIEIEIPSVNEVVRYIFKVENGETNIYDIDGNLIATPTGVYGLSLYWKNGIRLYGAKANGEQVWFIIKFEKQQEVIVNITTYDTFDFDAIKKVGSSADRPNTQYILVGYQYFDKTLQKPIWWNGTSWIDATGANVGSITR